MSELRLAVIGAQKAGSSHIAHCLGEHPEIHMVSHEVPYFQDPFYANTQQAALDAALESTKPVGAIKRPDYLAAPEVPKRLFGTHPKVQLITVLRPPIDRIVSAYYWYVQFGYLPLAPLNDGLAAVLDGRVSAHQRSHELLDNSRYGTHLRRWASVFEPDAIRVVVSNKVSDVTTYAEIFDSLGVRTDFVPPSLSKRTNNGTYDMTRLRFGQARKRFLFDWEDANSYTPKSPRRQVGWRIVPSTAMAVIDKGLLSRVFTDGPEQLSEGLRSRLNEALEPELQMLKDDYGIDLVGGKA